MASSTPMFSQSLFRGFDPTLNAPPEGQYDQYLPPHGYLTGQPHVEVSVPLSIDWSSTVFHGGQASYAQPEKPPQQNLQGQSFQGNPFASGGPFFTSQPTGSPGQPSMQQAQPGIQQGLPTGQTGQSVVNLNQPNVQYGPISGQVTQPLGQPTIQYTQPSGQTSQSQPQLGRPTAQPSQPSSLLG